MSRITPSASLISLVAMAVIAGLATIFAGCAGSVPEPRYYQLAAPAAQKPGSGALLVVDTLSTDTAYDDERIVYRTTPYRLDYYQYQRWTSSPGVLIGDYLEQALAASGQFRGVVRELTPSAPAVLGGRVVAIEEVDRSPTQWIGRIVVQLVLTDAHTGETLWSQRLEETEPMHQQTPEGLAAALSTAMVRICARAVPAIAGAVEQKAASAALPGAAPGAIPVR